MQQPAAKTHRSSRRSTGTGSAGTCSCCRVLHLATHSLAAVLAAERLLFVVLLDEFVDLLLLLLPRCLLCLWV